MIESIFMIVAVYKWRNSLRGRFNDFLMMAYKPIIGQEARKYAFDVILRLYSPPIQIVFKQWHG